MQVGWTDGVLSDLVYFQRGFDINKDQQQEGLIPVISSSGVQSYHSEAKVESAGVLIGRKGSLGTVYFSSSPYWPHSTTLWSKDLKGNHPKYVYYFLKTLQLERYNVGNSNPTLNRNHIHDLKIRIPSISLQIRIAEILSFYDDLIENNRRRIQLLEESARLLYQEWFVRLNFPNAENIKVVEGVPEGWERTTVFEIADVLSGGTPKTDKPEYWNGDIPFFTPKDTTNTIFSMQTEKYLTESGLQNCNSKLYPKNTLFITARGTVGKLRLAQLPMAMNQSCYALIGKRNITQIFLYCSLQASIDQFKARASGAVFDAIVIDTFKQIPFLKPTINLINEFTNIVLEIFSQIENLLLANQKLAQARDLLLPKLMNGELEV